MENIKKLSSLKLIVLTPIFILLSHYLIVFVHEHLFWLFLALSLCYGQHALG